MYPTVGSVTRREERPNGEAVLITASVAGVSHGRLPPAGSNHAPRFFCLVKLEGSRCQGDDGSDPPLRDGFRPIGQPEPSAQHDAKRSRDGAGDATWAMDVGFHGFLPCSAACRSGHGPCRLALTGSPLRRRGPQASLFSHDRQPRHVFAVVQNRRACAPRVPHPRVPVW